MTRTAPKRRCTHRVTGTPSLGEVPSGEGGCFRGGLRADHALELE
jgi:hypothetical protein